MPKTYVGGVVESCPYDNKQKSQLQCYSCQRTDQVSRFQCGHNICIYCARRQATPNDINKLVHTMHQVLHAERYKDMFKISNTKKDGYVQQFYMGLITGRGVLIITSDDQGTVDAESTVWGWLKQFFH